MTTVEWPREKHESDGDGAFSFLHEFAGDVVDGGDVVGVDSVTETEGVGEEGGSKKDGKAMEGGDGPEPGRAVEQEEQRVNANYLAADVVGVIVEEVAEGRHGSYRVQRKGHTAQGMGKGVGGAAGGGRVPKLGLRIWQVGTLVAMWREVLLIYRERRLSLLAMG